MPKLENAAHEAFAHARARGVKQRDAYLAAGFKGRSNASRMNTFPDVPKRIEEIKQALLWGGSSDLAPVINLLAVAAEKAIGHNSSASLVAARGLLAELAKLKRLLGESFVAAAEAPPREAPLTSAQWLAKYAPPR